MADDDVLTSESLRRAMQAMKDHARIYGLPVKIVESYVINEIEMRKALALPPLPSLSSLSDPTDLIRFRVQFDPTQMLRSMNAASLALAGLGEAVSRSMITIGKALGLLRGRPRPHLARARRPHRRKHPIIRRHRP